MTILDYYKEHLTHVFGEEKASRIITNSQIYTNNLYDDRSSDESTYFETTMNDLVLPLIGLYRAMLLEGFTEQEVGSYLKALWDIAPEELKTPESRGQLPK